MIRTLAVGAAVLAALTGAAVASAAAPQQTSAYDRHFLRFAAQTDRFEILAATAVRQRGGSADFCDLAARLLADHRRSSRELAPIAAQLRVTLPKTPTPLQQWAYGELQQAAPAAAAGAVGTPEDERVADVFQTLQRAAHREAIMMFEEASRVATSPRVREFAAATLPALREHLAMVNRLDTDELPETTRCES
jgi:putative membrane protein